MMYLIQQGNVGNMCKATVSNEELAVHQRLSSISAVHIPLIPATQRCRGGRRRDGDSGDSAVTWQLAIARQTPDTADTDMHCGLTVMIKP